MCWLAKGKAVRLPPEGTNVSCSLRFGQLVMGWECCLAGCDESVVGREDGIVFWLVGSFNL
jgi:hypothetical protein